MTTKRTRVSQIKGILSLQKKRSRLASQLATLDQQIAEKLERELSVASSEAAQPRSAAPRPAQVVAKGKPAKGGTRGPKGVLKEQILGLLEKAGASGATVKEIAAELDTKAANIHTWFSTNAKRIAGLSKVKAGHFKLGGKAGKAAKPKAAAPKAAAPKAKAKTTAKATRKPATKKAASTSAKGSFVPAKRGELKTSVLAELKKSGTAGISVKDLAEKVGTRYKNLYIWFVTTGKRIPGIEKVGPAQYRYSAKA